MGQQYCRSFLFLSSRYVWNVILFLNLLGNQVVKTMFLNDQYNVLQWAMHTCLLSQQCKIKKATRCWIADTKGETSEFEKRKVAVRRIWKVRGLASRILSDANLSLTAGLLMLALATSGIASVYYCVMSFKWTIFWHTSVDSDNTVHRPLHWFQSL